MDNPSPQTPLQTALERYKTALKCLDSSTPQDNILEILSARDALQKQLEAENQILPDILSELIEQDSKFKKQAYKITNVDLTEYRKSLPTTSQTWLLDLETAQQSHPWNRYECWLKRAKVLIWTVNVALFTTLATRFLSGGSGFLEVALIAFPGVLSLLQTQKELTKGERKCFYKILKGAKGFPHINSRLRKKLVIFFSSLISLFLFPRSSYKLFLIFLILVWISQPAISEKYKHSGKTHQTNQNLIVAEQNYLKAIAFDSENYDAHYKLATLYEELQEFDKAKKEYLIAIKDSHLPAYNNLAYWYIRQEKFLDAIALLEKSWVLVREREELENFEQLTPEEKLEFRVLKYNLAKNRGWAMLEAGQYEDAQDYLEAAIGLANSSEVKPYVKNPGAAHCLYAKLLEKQATESPDLNQINEQWQQCQDLIQLRLAEEQINTEEYQWLYEAKQRLKNSN